MARWRHPIQNRPYNVLVLLLLCKLFFGGSYDPGGSENHGGIKSPGGGVPVAQRLVPSNAVILINGQLYSVNFTQV